MSHTSAEASAAHTVEQWESIRHTAGFGRGVVRTSEIPALAAVQFAMLAHSKTSPQRGSDTVQLVEPPNVIGALDRGTEETSLVTRQRGEQVPQLISRDVSGARGLLDRKDLLQLLDRALTKRVTVISAPPGSGKTSLLRAWADRSTNLRRVAFVSVERDQQNEQRFWCAVLDAIRSPARSIDSETPPAPTAALDVDQVIDSVLSEVAEQVEPVVLIIDDLHELRSADALTQLEYLLAILPSSARVVLSSRRDPPIRLHQLRLADEVAEIRAGDLRFTERETRELLAASGISLSDAGVAALYQRTEGWAAGLRLAVISLRRSPGSRAFRGRVLGHRQGYRGIPDGRDARTPTERGSEHAVANLACRPAERGTRRPAGRPLGLGADAAGTGGRQRVRRVARRSAHLVSLPPASGGFPAPGAPPKVGR